MPFRKKDCLLTHGLEVVLVIISICLLSTEKLYSFPSSENTLRLPVGADITHRRLKSADDLTNSMYEIIEIDRNDRELIERVFEKDEGYYKKPKRFNNIVKLIQETTKKLVAIFDKRNSDIIGYIIVTENKNVQVNRIYLDRIFVSHGYRRSGFSRILIEYCMERFDSIVLCNVVRDLKIRYKMRNLFVRLGFKEIHNNVFIWEHSGIETSVTSISQLQQIIEAKANIQQTL